MLGWHCLDKWDILRKFNMDLDVVRSWLEFVEESYVDTTYHNREHAALCVRTRCMEMESA